MIGGGSDENDPEDRPCIPPPSPSPPSSPLQPTGGLGRRLLGSIRALLPAPPPAAAAAPKVGLGLLLHLRTDHPSLRPTPSASLPPDEDAVLGRGDGGSDAGAGLHSPVNNRCRISDGAATPATKVMFRHWAAKQPPHLPKPAADNVAVEQDQEASLAPVDGYGQDDRFCASGEPGASEEQNLVEEKGKVVEQQGAADTQGTSAKDVDAAGDDPLHKVLQQCTGDQLRAARDGDQEQVVINPGDATTCCGIAAAEDDQEKVGSAENVDDAVEDQKVVEQCVIDRKGVSTDGTAVGDQEKAVVSATANGFDRGTGKKGKVKLPYPQRPGKLNCPTYISKGTCSYGFSCQFRHPPLKAKPDGSWFPSEQRNQGVADILELNRIGLPIREGARNCTYYMRNGACRYGKHCHFNHPEHVIDAQFYAPTGWADSYLQLEKSSDHHTTVDDTSQLKKSSDDATVDDTSYSKKSSDHATLDDTSYSKKSSDHATLDDTSSRTGVLPPNIFRMLLPPQKVPARTEAKVIPVKKDSNWSCTSDDSDDCCSADSSDGPLCKQEHVDSSDGPLCKQEHVDYPERPGRPECPFYMRFGDCKFASACKYHHSKDKYPERPGEPECPFYMKNRFCKFGAQCRFNHPKDSNPAAQSPMNAKKYVATNEHHKPTRITLEHHMPQQQKYPERPGQPDCQYYLQFGKCKFLSACIFHHPRDVLPSGPAHSDQVGPETHGMPECLFYMKTRRCQFGSACEFRHPKDICSTTEGAFGHRTGSAYDNSTKPENAAQQREQTMYPERPGEPECNHYMRHGSCRFQMNCKYHHPAVRLSRKQYDSTYH